MTAIIIEERKLIFNYFLLVVLGMLLGGSLIKFLVVEDCIENGYSNITNMHCSEKTIIN